MFSRHVQNLIIVLVLSCLFACSLLWLDWGVSAAWAGVRPMTVLEFEKACRGPEGFRYGYGDFFDRKRTDARTAENRIASYPLTGSNTNSFGLYDMTGGVLEWVADVYLGDMTNFDYRNPLSEARVENYVARGGAYMMSDPAKKASCVFRYDINVSLEDVRNSTLGFRCASDAFR